MEDAKPLLKEKNKKVETQKIKKPTSTIGVPDPVL